jgi:hypothetical protein
LLEQLDTPLVLGLDEVDRVFPYQKTADEFFALLRSWFEAARSGDRSSIFWEKLRLVIVHSTEVYIPKNQSPFNVGVSINLTEFNFKQVLDLAQRYKLNWTEVQVQQLMDVVGGHPYLVRKALYHIYRQDISLVELRAIAPSDNGIYGDHLRHYLWILQQYPALARGFHQVAIESTPIELDQVTAFKLDSLGLVKLQGNRAVPRYDLYRQYFSTRLNNA